MSRAGRPALSESTTRRLPFDFTGCLVERVRWGGTQFDAVVALNTTELERRAAFELGPVLDYQLLDALATLPLGRPMRWDQIDPIQAAVLDCAPAGVVEATSTQVTNWLSPPVGLIGLFVVADHWRALAKIGTFGRVAPSGVVVRHVPTAMGEAVGAARNAGLGLAVLDADEPRSVVGPRPRIVHTTGRRRILEVVFGQWRRHTTRMPANSHQEAS